MSTKSLTVAADVTALVKARNPLIWIVSKEEARVEPFLFEAAAAAKCVTRTWDCGQGVCAMDGRPFSVGSTDLGDTLSSIISRANSTQADPCVWVLRDAAPWLAGPIGITAVRQLRNLSRLLPGKPVTQSVIVLSPSGDVPAELADHATVIEWPLPDRAEIEAILDAALLALPEDKRAEAINGSRDRAVDAAIGLSGEEAAAFYSKSLVQLRKIDPMLVTGEKKRIIAKAGVLEWLDPMPGGLSAVGGVENMKSWLVQRKLAYSPKARAYGLPSPKGIMMVGVPGGGKTLTAKSLAAEWGVPLLKLDMGALKSKFVGDSEANLRKAFRVIEAIGRCIVLIDEIEKAMAGATQGAADGGVSADALGALLSWMQDRKSEAFIMATANNVEALPPELLRKGRFDEIWFVGLPNRVERVGVLNAAMVANGLKLTSLKAEAIADIIEATEGFTGSEIAALVPDAMFEAFADDARQITTDDLVKAAKSVVPLSKTAAEKITKLQDWAKERARFASAPEQVETARPKARALQF